MNINLKTKTSLPKDLYALRSRIPESWRKAAGLLSRKRTTLERHVRRVHAEWDRKSR